MSRSTPVLAFLDALALCWLLMCALGMAACGPTSPAGAPDGGASGMLDGGVSDGEAPCGPLGASAVIVEWSNVRLSPRCEGPLSGPWGIGAVYDIADEGSIEITDGTVGLTLGRNVVFGGAAGGLPVDLVRERDCSDFGGSLLREITETIRGAWRSEPTSCAESTLEGTYSYRECYRTGGGECIPTPDDCAVTADLRLRTYRGTPPDREPPRPEPDAFCAERCDDDLAARVELDCRPERFDRAACTTQCGHLLSGQCADALVAYHECLRASTPSIELRCDAAFGELLPSVFGTCAETGSRLNDVLRLCITTGAVGACESAARSVRTGTAEPSASCLANDECRLGTYCRREVCSGAGTCVEAPTDLHACFRSPPAMVCSCDGRTYFNRCFAELDGASIASAAACP